MSLRLSPIVTGSSQNSRYVLIRTVRTCLYPALDQGAWSQALRVFGPSHVLVVSNSAGTRDDAAQLQAESVSHHLRVPVLLHASLKPSYSCTAAIFSALPDLAPHQLVVVGDRIFTDVALAHRLAHPRTILARIAARLGLAPAQPGSSSGGADGGSSASVGGPLAVWTTGVWMRESMAMRQAETWLVHLVERWVQGARERRDALEERFVKRALDGENRPEKADGRAWFSWVKVALPKLGRPRLRRPISTAVYGDVPTESIAIPIPPVTILGRKVFLSR